MPNQDLTVHYLLVRFVLSLQCLLELVKENELLEKLISLLCDVSENRNHYAAGTQDVHAAGMPSSRIIRLFIR